MEIANNRDLLPTTRTQSVVGYVPFDYVKAEAPYQKLLTVRTVSVLIPMAWDVPEVYIVQPYVTGRLICLLERLRFGGSDVVQLIVRVEPEKVQWCICA